MTDKFSRRDFFKVTLLNLSTAFLAACERFISPTSEPSVTVTSTNTNTPEPTTTKTQTPAPIETATPTKIPCFHLLTPENGAILSAVGKVTLSWEPMLGAASYN